MSAPPGAPKVLMIVADNTLPGDPRVERELATLEGRYDARVVCRPHPAGLAHPRAAPHAARSWLPAFLAYGRWRLLPGLVREVRREGYALVHAHDMPSAFLGLLLARLTGKPFVVELHENWGAMLHDFVGAGKFVQPFILPWLLPEERIVLRAADAVVVVGEVERRRVVALGAPEDRVTILRNVPLLAGLEVVPRPPAAGASPGLRVVYVGSFSARHGLETVIRAVALARDRVPGISLTIVGTSGVADYDDRLRALAKERGVEDRVRLTGRLPHREAMALVAEADVGVAPFLPSPNMDAALPNKLFEYMYYGLPVVASRLPEMAHVLKDMGSALLAEPGDAAAFADAFAALADPALRARMGEAGARAVRERWNWEVEGRALLALYGGLLSTDRSRGASKGTTRAR